MSLSWISEIELLHLAVTSYLCGVIWLVQKVHYPSFQFVSQKAFLEFHRFHSQSITPVVAPAMVLELLSSIALLWLHRGEWLWLLNFLSVVLIWGVTFGISAPLHKKLAEHRNWTSAPLLIHRLIATNWLRTGLWSLRAIYLWITLSSF